MVSSQLAANLGMSRKGKAAIGSGYSDGGPSPKHFFKWPDTTARLEHSQRLPP